MKLSVELFERTVGQLKGEAAAERVERRTAPRIGLRARIQMTPLLSGGGVGAPIDVWTHDISRLGLGIISSKKLKVGSQYLLTLPHEESDDGKPWALLCTVRNSHMLTPDIYATGFAFEDMRTKQFPATRT